MQIKARVLSLSEYCPTPASTLQPLMITLLDPLVMRKDSPLKNLRLLPRTSAMTELTSKSKKNIF